MIWVWERWPQIESDYMSLRVIVWFWEWLYDFESDNTRLRVIIWVWEWLYEFESGYMILRVMIPDWEWLYEFESDCMSLRVMIPDWEWYQAEPTRVICWGSVNRVEWKPQSRHRVSFEIKRWPKSAGTEIVRHIFIVTFPSWWWWDISWFFVCRNFLRGNSGPNLDLWEGDINSARDWVPEVDEVDLNYFSADLWRAALFVQFGGLRWRRCRFGD